MASKLRKAISLALLAGSIQLALPRPTSAADEACEQIRACRDSYCANLLGPYAMEVFMMYYYENCVPPPIIDI